MKLLAAGLLGIFLAKKSFSHGGHHKTHSEMTVEKGDKKGTYFKRKDSGQPLL